MHCNSSFLCHDRCRGTSSFIHDGARELRVCVTGSGGNNLLAQWWLTQCNDFCRTASCVRGCGYLVNIPLLPSDSFPMTVIILWVLFKLLSNPALKFFLTYQGFFRIFTPECKNAIWRSGVRKFVCRMFASVYLVVISRLLTTLTALVFLSRGRKLLCLLSFRLINTGTHGFSVLLISLVCVERTALPCSHVYFFQFYYCLQCISYQPYDKRQTLFSQKLPRNVHALKAIKIPNKKWLNTSCNCYAQRQRIDEVKSVWVY